MASIWLKLVLKYRRIIKNISLCVKLQPKEDTRSVV